MTSPTPDYAGLAARSIQLYDTYIAANPSLAPSSASSLRYASEPKSAAELGAMDFEEVLPKEQDRYLLNNFVEGTWAGKLESTKEGEQGFYNVAIDPSPRTPYSLILPTKDYHPQSAPLRPGYLLHAHRLLVALEDQLAQIRKEPTKVVAIYDCGEKSGAVKGHKCIRFYVVNSIQESPLLQSFRVLPDPTSPVLLETFVSLLSDSLVDHAPSIPLQPHYNLFLTRTYLSVVRRTDDGFRGGQDGRWDGARLVGVGL